MTNRKPFVNWVLHGIELLFHPNFIYWLSPTATLEQSLRAIWDAASQAAVLILPQIKLNSQLSSCTSFFVDSLILKFGLLHWQTCKYPLLGGYRKSVWESIPSYTMELLTQSLKKLWKMKYFLLYQWARNVIAIAILALQMWISEPCQQEELPARGT